MRRDAALLHWLMVPAALALLLLLGLSLHRMGRTENPLDSSGQRPPTPAPHPAADQTRQYFGWADAVDWQPLTNSSNPFFTLAIRPPPPPQPPPPPPKTLKVEVTYRGFFQTAAGVRRAVVQVAEKQVLGGLGDVIVGDFRAAAIELRQLVVTNATQTNTFTFAKAQPLEIPAQ